MIIRNVLQLFIYFTIIEILIVFIWQLLLFIILLLISINNLGSFIIIF